MTAPPRLQMHLVCTANVCRSVMAQALLRRSMPPFVGVSSSGLLATGAPPDPQAIAALADLGIHVDADAPSRRVTRHGLEAADLVLGLSMHHVRDVVVLDRQLFPRTFALGELIDLARRRGPRRRDEPLQEWLARMHEGRTTEGLLVEHSEHDITDPTGGPREAYEQTLQVIAERIGDLVDSLRLVDADIEPIGQPKAAVLQLVPLADRASLAAARTVLAPSDLLSRLRSVEHWDELAGAAGTVVQEAGGVVLCFTTEPHGVAMTANRDPTVRAVVVSNRGMVVRSLRRLNANLFCTPSGLETQVLAQIVQALHQV